MKVPVLLFALIASGSLVTARAASAQARTITGMWAAQTDRNVVTLVWKNPGNVRVYRVHRDDPNGRRVPIATLAGNSNHYVAIVRRGDPTTLKYYLEAASDPRGSGVLVPFNEVTLVTPTRGPVPAPANVVAREDAGRIIVTWDVVPGATAYQIFRAVGGSGTGTLCGMCPTRTELVDTVLTTNVRYVYAVAAQTAGGLSLRTRSNELTPTTAVTVASATSATITGLAAEQIGPSLVHLRWNAGSGVKGYLITLDAGAKQSTVARLDGAVSEYTASIDPRSIAGGSTNTLQYYLQALNESGGKSDRIPFNKVVIARAAAVAPTPPPSVIALQTARGMVTVTWRPSEQARTYQVERLGARERKLLCRSCPDTTFLDSIGGPARLTYQVTAVNETGRSTAVQSNPVEVGSPGSGVPELTAPTRVLTKIVGDSIRIGWDGLSRNATAYRITRVACGNTTTMEVRTNPGLKEVAGRDRVSTILKLPACARAAKPVDVQYAVGALYYSVAGPETRAAPLQIGGGTPPPPPGRLSATFVENRVELKWERPRDAITEYRITRRVCGVETVTWVGGTLSTRNDVIAPILAMRECAAVDPIVARYSIASARNGFAGEDAAFPEVALPKTITRKVPDRVDRR